MTSLSKAILIGKLGRDVETQTLPSGDLCAKFSVATSVKSKTGVETTWHNVSCFKNNADFAVKYLQKGSVVYVEGRLRCRKYEAGDGSAKERWEVLADEVKSFRSSENGSVDDAPLPAPKPAPPKTRPRSAPFSIDDLADDLPFN
jgi:single-strand DNA-binding protein